MKLRVWAEYSDKDTGEKDFASAVAVLNGKVLRQTVEVLGGFSKEKINTPTTKAKLEKAKPVIPTGKVPAGRIKSGASTISKMVDEKEEVEDLDE